MSNVYHPVSTYRIQFHKDFTFRDFENIIPYLVKLGIKTVYASPVFEAGPGSLHGYDGTDPNHINPEIGTEQELVAIATTLREKGIHWLQDIVPNHLAFHENNKWLMDVLRNGPDSPYAGYFDIDWQHPELGDKLMVPFPGSSLEETLKDQLPESRYYRVCHWTETDKRINYRRFFIVNSLICTNIQDAAVFESFHALIKKLVRSNVFQGLRVDHVDGLYDPKKYLEALRGLSGEQGYIVVEKILEPGEELAEDWPVQGNSGYDFLGMINNLLTYNGAEYALTPYYADITGDSIPAERQIHDKKRHILFTHMNGELDNLVRLYKKLRLSEGKAENDNQLRDRIAAYLIECPVYRYYGDGYPLMPEDKGKDPDSLKEFYTRCMQFTGPLMAKGVEDTLMYTYNRFIGHNEVGDSPEFFGYTVPQFHQLMLERQKKWPLSLNGTSTHDTKRGEDARARLNVLTDLHEEWMELCSQWRKENTHLKSAGAPDSNDEYFIYQTLLASYPYPSINSGKEEMDYPGRIAEYLYKALREAKVHSDWSAPDEAYEKAAVQFAHALIGDRGAFGKSFEPFLRKVADYGMINSFSQLVLKFFCPGVPDVYQGTELWDLSLVDPDNRRPVDYKLRENMLNNGSKLADLWNTRETGQIKLSLLHLLLKLRNRFADMLITSDYIPLETSGQYKDNVFAFMRRHQQRCVVVAIPLHLALIHLHSDDSIERGFQCNWQDTKIILPAGLSGQWEDLVSGDEIRFSGELLIDDLFNRFPAALLANRV